MGTARRVPDAEVVLLHPVKSFELYALPRKVLYRFADAGNLPPNNRLRRRLESLHARHVCSADRHAIGLEYEREWIFANETQAERLLVEGSCRWRVARGNEGDELLLHAPNVITRRDFVQHLFCISTRKSAETGFLATEQDRAETVKLRSAGSPSSARAVRYSFERTSDLTLQPLVGHTLLR